MEHSVIAIEEIIKEARGNYSRLEEDANEANVRHHIVVPFMIGLGYKNDWMHLEERTDKGRDFYDISIFIGNQKLQILTVEVKRKGYSLTYKEKKQVLNYVNENNRSPWAILTNGREFLLLNNDIIGDFDDRVVFKFDILKDNTNKCILKYFTLKCIFYDKVSIYFKHITQYKAYYNLNHKLSSFKSIENTLFNFFDYLSTKEEAYIELSSIRIGDFEKYIVADRLNKKETKKRIPDDVAITNKYTYISNMYDAFIKRNELKENPFSHKAEEYRTKVLKKKKVCISDEEFKLMISFYTGKRDEIRNKLILLLLFYTGMSRSEIMLLQESQINLENKYIEFDNRKIPLIDYEIVSMIEKYKKIKRKKHLVSTYFLPSNYGNCKNNPMSPNNYNNIVNKCLKQEEFTKQRRKDINLNLIKETIIIRMNKNKYNIDEIAYFAGLSMSTISTYFSSEEICTNINRSKFVKNHPFGKFFNINPK